jgi:AcrR family transcriptional regulator
VETHRVGHDGDVPSLPESETSHSAGGLSQRQHIIDTALMLMAQRGVDGTSMRDLAGAAGLNVASLYHYFPSKRDLLVAVLEERGLTPAAHDPSRTPVILGEGDDLASWIFDMLASMLSVENFIRLMLGEVLRGDETAFGVGVELFSATEAGLEEWLKEHEPALCAETSVSAVAQMLRAVLVGTFFEHVAGVLGPDEDPIDAFRRRADDVAAILGRARSA